MNSLIIRPKYRLHEKVSFYYSPLNKVLGGTIYSFDRIYSDYVYTIKVYLSGCYRKIILSENEIREKR